MTSFTIFGSYLNCFYMRFPEFPLATIVTSLTVLSRFPAMKLNCCSVLIKVVIINCVFLGTKVLENLNNIRFSRFKRRRVLEMVLTGNFQQILWGRSFSNVPQIYRKKEKLIQTEYIFDGFSRLWDYSEE